MIKVAQIKKSSSEEVNKLSEALTFYLKNLKSKHLFAWHNKGKVDGTVHNSLGCNYQDWEATTDKACSWLTTSHKSSWESTGNTSS